ncbi:hypothetical protein [Actinomycetospora chiangmaiensis]|uniref:hypothetical protein n=1 Tax=Actinomycetospora chiangmaiensis TaxID=402650 RepID=UPI0012FA7D70|nr:hypothetical protein [Actinomycetospora chiangmaiensis]
MDTDRTGGSEAVTEAFVGGAADAAVRGVDEVLGREVRLVTLPPATGEALTDRIEQVRHLARLHHPHLLEVYDVDGLAPDTESTLVLESVAGEPLPLVLRDGPVPPVDLARMGAQLASALAHAHAHHVEHGAVGPASILVNRAGAEAWLVGLTASLSGPLPVIAEVEDAAARRAADVRALARTLAEVAAHDGEADAEGLVALLRDADSAVPPSAAALSERLIRFGRDDTPATDDAVAARLVPVVASWAESPAVPAETGPTVGVPVAVGPAVRTPGRSGVTPFAVVHAQRARRAGVLAAATATLALASGLVIWAGESHVVRSVPQAEVGSSVAAPAGLPALPVFVPAVPVTAGDSSGSADADTGNDPGGWTRTAESSSATPPASREQAAPSTGETSTTPGPTTTRPDPTTTRPDPTATTTVPPTTKPVPPTTKPVPTTTKPVPTTTTTPPPAATSSTVPASVVPAVPPTTTTPPTTTVVPPTTTTTTPALPVSSPSSALLALGL